MDDSQRSPAHAPQVSVNYPTSAVITPAHSTAHHQVTVIQGLFPGMAQTTANLVGDVRLAKCGKQVSEPIGQLLSLPRDAGQSPLPRHG